MKRAVFLLALATGCSSTENDPPADAGADTSIAVEHDEPCGPDPRAIEVPSTRVSILKSKKPPVAKAALASPLDPKALRDYESQGLGDYELGPGEPGVVVDTLLAGAGSSTGKTGRKSVMYFVHMADTQLSDDESTTRLLSFDNPTAPGAGRPQEASIGLATSAMHRTLARISKTRPFDFEIVTGDCIDNAQQNEIEWFVDLMNGKKGLHLDSGNDDDPVIGPGNDPKDPFDPTPAPAPWYFVFGNHDVENQGTSVPDEIVKTHALGDEPKNGTRDYRKKGAPVTRDPVPADPGRRPVTRGEMIAVLQGGAPTPGPVGHGFAGVRATMHPANFVVDLPGKPVRLVQLDTNDPFGGSDGLVYQKTIDEFLEPTLAKADAEGKLVILASHHATTNIDPGKGLDSTPVPGAVTGKVVEDAVAKHPSVVLWLVGHNHRNRVRAVLGPSADAPGYYEVMTSAIADWPSQARAIELVTLPDGTLSIFTTMVDFDLRTCLEDRFRRWSLIDVNSAWSHDGSGRVEDRNVELRRALPKGVTFAAGVDKIETETTLVGK